MKTEHALAEALKKTMMTTPIEEISVTLLTNKCHLKRQSFYYHFHDIYDLLTQVFLDEKIPNLEQVKNIDQMIEALFKYYVINQEFIDATIFSAGKSLFEEFIYNQTYHTIFRLISEKPISKNLHPIDKKNISRFYSLSYSYSYVYYLSSYKSKTLSGLKNTFCFVNDENIQKSLHKLVEMRKKANVK